MFLGWRVSACSPGADYYKMKVTLSQVFDPEDVSNDMDDHKIKGVVKYDRGNRFDDSFGLNLVFDKDGGIQIQ